MQFVCDAASRCVASRSTCLPIPPIGPRAARCSSRWTNFVRGDIHRLRAPRNARGHEQQGGRYAVILQADDLLLSTVLVAPTSRSAAPRIFRPTISIGSEHAQVLVEQAAAVDPERLGQLVGHITRDEVEAINASLRLAFELD